LSVEQIEPKARLAVATTASDLHWRQALVVRLHTLYTMRGRIIRFSLTGGTGAVVQLSLLSVLLSWGWSHLLANGAAFLVSMQVNFWLNQHFTWRDREAPSGMRVILARWARFHGAVAGTAVLNMAVFALAATELPHLLAAALGIGVASVANFVTGDRFVFRAGAATSGEPIADRSASR
jgi:putative flippase GtrA